MSWYDNGMPVINDAEVLATAELIKRLLASPEGSNGGPLHVIIIDGNTGDEHVHDSSFFGRADGRQIETYLCKPDKGTWIGGGYHHAYLDELHCSEETADLCRLILASFRRMSEPWRAAAIAWADGTIAKSLPILVDNPEAACTASPEQVEALIAELRQAEDAPASTEKACISVPCPPLTDVFPGREAVQGVERVRYEQTIHAPGIRVTKLDEHGQPIGESRLVGGWVDVGVKTDPPGSGGPELKWLETTVRFDMGGVSPDLWQVLYGWEWPRIDMDAVRNESPRVEVPKLPQDTPEPWSEFVARTSPLMLEIPPGQVPVFVNVPEGSTVDAVGKAISLCRQLGLLKDAPGGHAIVPHGIHLDSGGFFIMPPGTDVP